MYLFSYIYHLGILMAHTHTGYRIFLLHFLIVGVGFPGGSAVKNPPAKAGEAKVTGLILGSGSSPGGGHGNSLQYSCLENPMDRGTWRATVKRITKS